MQTTTTLTSGAASDAFIGGFFATLGIFAVFLAIIGFAVAIVTLIAEWKIFTKAGEPGWKVLIPFYNMYIVFKLFWDKKWFWITLAVTFCTSFATGLISGITKTDSSAATTVISICSSIFDLVIGIILTHRISKSFGHGVGFTLGLIFLAPIFTCILGFNKDKYKKLPDVE